VISGPNRRRLAIVAIVIAAAGGQRLMHSTREARRQAAQSTTADATSRAVDDSLQLGQLTLKGCDIGSTGMASTIRAYCTMFTVPEDWQAPAGRKIQLKVAVVRSRGANPAPDLLVFLDGGPGGAATNDYPGLIAGFSELRSRRNLLLIDQRGTGGSNELRCEARTSDADPEREKREEVQRQAIDRNQFDKAGFQATLKECLAKLESRASPEHYATTAAVRDLEAVRVALGSPQLDLIGTSYGTRMAQQYAGTYPTAVRSVVLDSAVPNTLVLGTETSINLDDALKARFEQCKVNPECAKRFGDPYASMYRLRDQLRARPQQVSLRDPVTFSPVAVTARAADLAVTVRLFAYHAATVALLPLTIDDALHGNYGPLLGQRKLITDAVNDALTDGMGLSVSCADDADLIQPRPQDANLMLGDMMTQYMVAACEVWPRGTRSATFHQAWKSAIPTLILAGEFDPITPPRYGREIAGGLSNVRLLLLKGQGHGLIETGCVPRLTGEFIDRLQPSAINAQCLDSLGNVPAFLSYSGAAP
jgi:pimeloyl-ACP methyl ester carboxylesterase